MEFLSNYHNWSVYFVVAFPFCAAERKVDVIFVLVGGYSERDSAYTFLSKVIGRLAPIDGSQGVTGDTTGVRVGLLPSSGPNYTYLSNFNADSLKDAVELGYFSTTKGINQAIQQFSQSRESAAKIAVFLTDDIPDNDKAAEAFTRAASDAHEYRITRPTFYAISAIEGDLTEETLLPVLKKLSSPPEMFNYFLAPKKQNILILADDVARTICPGE